MTRTKHHDLAIWSPEDRIMMEEFNKITATLDGMGNCCIACGSRTGDGGWGPDHPTTMTFPFKPLMVIPNCTKMESDGTFDLWARPLAVGYSTWLSVNKYHITWTDNGISWYTDSTNGDAPELQLNRADKTYHWVAIGLRE